MSFIDDVKIDKYALDVEWERQSYLYMKWAENYADVVFERDKAKENLDIVKAELDSDIRLNPEKWGFDKKPTETAILSSIIRDSRYIEANNRLLEINRDMNIMAGAKEAMNHKKKALESITQLWLGGYYSEPNIPKEAKDISEKKTREKINKVLTDKLNKRQKK